MFFEVDPHTAHELGIEPPDAENVAVRSRDHSLVSSLKERVRRRNLISLSARPGVDIACTRCEFDNAGPEEPVRLLWFWQDQYFKLQHYILN